MCGPWQLLKMKFSEMDYDENGKVSMDELRKEIKWENSIGVRQLFDQLDANADGVRQPVPLTAFTIRRRILLDDRADRWVSIRSLFMMAGVLRSISQGISWEDFKNVTLVDVNPVSM